MRKITISIFISLMFSLTVFAQQTTTFSYQGKLNNSSSPTNGIYDFRFELFDAVSGGTLIGSQTSNNITVTSGIFSVQLNFGANAFNGNDRFLEISVKQTSASSFTTLTPRQKLASVPYATKAINSDTATIAQTANNATSLGGITANNYLQKNGDASQLTNINGASITNNTVSSSALASDVFPNQQNLKLLGSLRWDLLGKRVNIGTTPYGLAFDGENIWTANNTGNNVTKMRASDGVILGNFAVGTSPINLAFDGTNIWVSNNGINTVTKLRASDGANLGTFTVGSAPFGLAFDGSNIWVANQNSNTISKLRASDGANLGTFASGSIPAGIAFDGANIWVSALVTHEVVKFPVFP